MKIASCCNHPIGLCWALGESSCNKVRSVIWTSCLILFTICLSYSEKSSVFSNAFARISSASRSWLQNHLMSFDTFSIFLSFLLYDAKIWKKAENKKLFCFSCVFRAFVNKLLSFGIRGHQLVPWLKKFLQKEWVSLILSVSLPCLLKICLIFIEILSWVNLLIWQNLKWIENESKLK